jgi:hypothetical protein
MDDQYNAGVSALTGRGVPNISMAADTADGARANELIKASADQVYFHSYLCVKGPFCMIFFLILCSDYC